MCESHVTPILYHLPTIPTSLTIASTGTQILTVLNYVGVAYDSTLFALDELPDLWCQLELGIPLPSFLSLSYSFFFLPLFPTHLCCVSLSRWIDSLHNFSGKMCSSYCSDREHLYRHEFKN